MSKNEKLNRRDQVVINYKANGGNMKKAMIDAGYSETYADRNSKYLLGIIGEQIKTEQDAIKSKSIKTIEEIQEYWSNMMYSAESEGSQIKCSELLAKSLGGFVEKIELNNKTEFDEKVKEMEEFMNRK